MREVGALAVKDLKLLLHDRMGLFFGVGFPLVFAVFFGTISSGFASGGTSLVPVAVVDLDGTDASRRFLADVAESGTVELRETTEEQARELVRRGKVAAYFVVPEGFAKRRDRAFLGGEPLHFETGADPSRAAESAMLEGVLMRALFEPLREAMGGRDPVVLERRAVERRRFGPNNAFAVSFPQAVLWGILGCAAGFGISLVVERTQGTLARLCVAPVSRAQVLAGKALACFVTIVVVTSLLLAIGVVVFGVRPGSYPLLGLGILCNALGFVGVMMLLSVVGKSERAAAGIGWGVLVLLAMIGGGMIPLFVMPAWLQAVGSASPVKWGILALEGAIWRNFSLAEMLVPCGIVLGFGLACFVAGVTIFRWTSSAG